MEVKGITMKASLELTQDDVFKLVNIAKHGERAKDRMVKSNAKDITAWCIELLKSFENESASVQSGGSHE